MLVPRILVTKPIPESGLSLLRASGDLTVGPAGAAFTVAELREAVRGRDAVLSFVADPLTAEVLEAAAPTCRVIAQYGVGTDNIDLDAATRLGIQIANTPDVLTESTADLAFALLLAACRGFSQAMRLAADGTWPGIEPMQIFGHDVFGQTLGLVGAGRIAQAVARRARGFDMAVVYTSRHPKPELDAAGARMLALDELLRTADIVSLHVPLTPQTRRLIAARELALMKPTAYLINTSRGAVVNQADLIAALRDRRIAGAGLDVFEREPQIPAELLTMPHVVCLPHIGSATHETRDKMAVVAAENLLAVLSGRPPRYPVNQVAPRA